jgi:acyl dehydratase
MLTINGISGLRDRAGQELGTSAWHEVTQECINAFAAATDDYEKIHVSAERARQTPFGVTIAHGLYTLSLGPKFLYELFAMDDIGLALNYGFERVRFISPVPVNSRLRMQATLLSVRDVPPPPGTGYGEAVRATIEERFEIEGVERPACVATAVVIYMS